MHVQTLHRSQFGQAARRSTSPPGSTITTAIRAASLPVILALVITALLIAPRTTRNPEPIPVSVRDVVIDPYAVDGKLVRLDGLLHHTGDGNALYWHQADIKQSIESHAVAVHYSSSPHGEVEPDGTYVALEGIFYATNPARRGWSSDAPPIREQFNGALVDARRVQVR